VSRLFSVEAVGGTSGSATSVPSSLGGATQRGDDVRTPGFFLGAPFRVKLSAFPVAGAAHDENYR